MWPTFVPLRKKVGSLALLMSCLFAAAWLRSLCCTDRLEVSLNSKGISVTSSDQRLVCGYNECWVWNVQISDSEDGDVQFTTKDPSVWIIDSEEEDIAFAKHPFKVQMNINEKFQPISEMFDSQLEFTDENRFQFCGLDFGYLRGRITSGYGSTESIYLVPYWWLTTPLILLSGWLLIGRPAQSTRATSSQPIPKEEGGAS